MPDMKQTIFGREMNVGTPYTSDDTTLTFNNGGDAENLVVQRVSITYTQQISRAFEIGSNKAYFVAGNQDGTAEITRLAGPGALVGGFIKQYGDVCNAPENTLMIRKGQGACDGEGGEVHAQGCVITSVAYTMQAENMTIQETTNLLVAVVNDEGGNGAGE